MASKRTSFNHRIYSKDMKLPLSQSPKKRKNPIQKSMGYKTGENCAGALARFQAIKDLMSGKSTPSHKPAPCPMEVDSGSTLESTFPTQSQHDAPIDSFDYLQGDDAGYPCYAPDPLSIPPQPAHVEQSTQLLQPDQQPHDSSPPTSAKDDEQLFFASFEALITLLEKPYLRYVSTIQKGISPERIPHVEERPCQCKTRITRTRIVTCYLYSGMSSN